MASLPDPVLNELRCYKCKNFLSCRPISVTNRGDSICGRCKANESVMLAHAYETVAEYFLFPCKNWEQHCAYLLNIKDVMEHEKDCSFGNCCSICCFNPGSLFKPDNKLDLTQSLKFYNIPDEEVLSVLTCSLCGYYLSSCPIHINTDGYNICHRCHATKDGKVPLNYIRHKALETILQILLFPCVYRKRGCTKVFRFGYNTDHERMCSYSRTQKSFSTFTDPNNGKQKGIIETHTGHMFGTITPYSQFFSAQNKVATENASGVEPLKVVPNEKQERFFNQLLKHRESLQYQWNRNSKIDGSNSPPKIVNGVNKSVPDGIEEISDEFRERPSFRNDDRQGFTPSIQRQTSNRNESSPSLPRNEAFSEEQFARLSPSQDTFDTRDPRTSSPNKRNQSSSSGSDVFNPRGSPRPSTSSQPTRTGSPLKLNPTELMQSNSFNYTERQDRSQFPERHDSFASNRDNGRNFSPQVHQNTMFMY